MHALLVAVVLLTLVLQPAAATTSGMDQSLLFSAPLEPLYTGYPDPEGLLDICALCNYSVEFCICSFQNPPRRPTFTPDTFYGHPEWGMLPDLPDDQPEPLPEQIVHRVDSQPLHGEALRFFEDNATTVRHDTVGEHVKDTYLPGDRLEQEQQLAQEQEASPPRRLAQRRHTPRTNGYVCDICKRPFNRACELNRHKKTHATSKDRPHKCSVCDQGFLYPKDKARHERTHVISPSPDNTLFCRVEGCGNDGGFSRRDNLLRHHRKQHPGIPIPAA